MQVTTYYTRIILGTGEDQVQVCVSHESEKVNMYKNN